MLVYTEIAKDIGVNECWIMGDDNPIYHAFIQNKDFKSTAKINLQVAEVAQLCQKYGDDYEIKGHYKVKMK